MDTALYSLEKTYKIEKEIGSGGMGVVYLATDKRLDRQVAIKVLKLSGSNSESGVSESEVIERFQREAKAVAKLTHPNIINIHDIGSDDGLYYMVMEFVDGTSVSDMIENKQLDLETCVNIGVQICSALDMAHEQGIIHRDIKPANIIYSKKNIAKLMDFGIAQLAGKQDKDAFKLTQAGSVLGSIMYISPEQLNDASKVDLRTDIYSFGMSLYEMLTGQLPFMAENISNIVLKILSHDPPNPSSYNFKIPKGLDNIILKSLVKNPSQRYQTAGEMKKDLEKVLYEIKNVTTKTEESTLVTENSMNSDMMFGNINKSSTVIMNNMSTVISSSENIKEDFNKLDSIDHALLPKSTPINETLINSLEKDWSWLKHIAFSWKRVSIEGKNVAEILEKIVNNKTYSSSNGIISISNEVFIFWYQGYIVGGVNITNNTVNEDFFYDINRTVQDVEFSFAPENCSDAPVILASMFNYENPFHINLDSSTMDLLPLIENFSSEFSPFSGFVKCYTESNIFYYGYAFGKNIFVCMADPDDDSISPEIYNNLKKLVTTNRVILNTYSIKPEIFGTTLHSVLKIMNLNLKYRSYSKSELSHIIDLGTDDIPNYLLKEIKQNLHLDLELNQSPKIKLLDKEIDLSKVVNESVYYKFVDWLVNDYIYQINSTGNTQTLKLLYTAIPAIENIKFFEKLSLDNKNIEFSIAMYGKVKGEHNKKALFVVRVGNGNKIDVENFITDANLIKKNGKVGDIHAAFYISQTPYEVEIDKLFSEKTVEPKKSFLSLDATAKYKGFIKHGYGKGFHLNLIEYNYDTGFKVFLPAL
ncbi:MAG: serine/threonine-protein kinase [Candidatus Sericytochromatia bacterium]